MDDGLSVEHFKSVLSEIQGRFFSAEEADRLKAELDRHTITDAQTRVLGDQAWSTAKRD